jgi:hypothetical protein
MPPRGTEKGHGLCCAPSLFAWPVAVCPPAILVRCYHPLSSSSARCSAHCNCCIHPTLANICTKISEQSVDILYKL